MFYNGSIGRTQVGTAAELINQDDLIPSKYHNSANADVNQSINQCTVFQAASYQGQYRLNRQGQTIPHYNAQTNRQTDQGRILSLIHI